MAIIDISDAYIVIVGMLYPSYLMLKDRSAVQNHEHWYRYWAVFGLGYAVTELTESFLYAFIPFITFFQVTGVSLLVYTKCSDTLYEGYVVPWFEKFMDENKQYKDIVELKYKEFTNYLSKVWTSYIPVKISFQDKLK